MPYSVKKFYHNTVGFTFADKESEAYMTDVIRRAVEARRADNDGQMVRYNFRYAQTTGIITSY